MGRGPAQSKVMLIGEAPGKREDDIGKPFAGPSGKLLDDCLPIDRESVYITNAVHCRPPLNRTPTKGEIKACSHWLNQEIQQVQPQFIMLLGNVPLQSMLGIKGIGRKRGRVLEFPGSKFNLPHDRVYVFPTYHPAHALRDPRTEPVVRKDVDQFFKIVERGGPRVQEGLSYHIVQDEAGLRRCLDDIKDNSVLAWDLETSGLDPLEKNSYIASFGVGTEKHQWCIPLNHTRGRWHRKFNTQARWVERVVEAMRGRTIVAHNGKFDTRWLKTIFGHWLHVDFDTMLAHYQLNENAFHALDILATKYLNAIDYDIPLEEKQGYGPLDRHCEYLALDLFYTRRLHPIFSRRLDRDPKTRRIFYELTMPVARMYAEIEYNGVYVNQERLHDARQYWLQIEEDCEETLNRLVPSNRQWKDKHKKVRNGINWGSAKQVGEVLFGRLGLSPLDKTNGGANSVSESVLKRLASKHEIPNLLLKYREAVKNRGTFIEGWAKRCHNSRMHPHFKVHGTVTGRPSAEDPNLQQVPRNPKLRSIIDAPEGWVLVDADLSQAEMRIATEMSGDPTLVQTYRTGVDVHTLTVGRVFGIMTPTKEERKRAKAVNFGFLYGMGHKKFREYARDKYDIEFSESESISVRKQFFHIYSGLPAWHDKQRKLVRTQGYVRSILGRKRRLPDALIQSEDERDLAKKHEAERQAINSPVQSLASDLNLMAALELHRKFGGTDFFRLVGTIHDSILMEVRKDKLDVVLPAIRQAMENPFLFKKWGIVFKTPIECGIEIGPWGAGKKYE